MQGDELKAQAIAWFGETGWQRKLSALLGISRSTLWRQIENNMVSGPVVAAVQCWQAHGLPEGAQEDLPLSPCPICGAAPEVDHGPSDAPYAVPLISCATVHVVEDGHDQTCPVFAQGRTAWEFICRVAKKRPAA